MKLKDIKVDDIVFVKKSNKRGVDPLEKRKVSGIYEIWGTPPLIRITLWKIKGIYFSPAELTEIPCSEMICGDCLYHKKG